MSWQPIDKWEFTASYMLVRQVELEAAYHLTEAVKLYAGYRAWNERYQLTTRRDQTERLWYYEQRVHGGVKWDINPDLWVDLNAGFAFDRFYFLGKDWDDRDEGRLDVDDGPFIRFQVGLSF